MLIHQGLAEELEAGAPLAHSVYADLRQTLRAVCENIRAEEPSLRLDLDAEFRYDAVGATDLLWIVVGEGHVNLQLRVKCKVVPRSRASPEHESNASFWREHLPDDAICFTFAVEGGVVAAHSTNYLQGRWLTIGRDGGISLQWLNAAFGAFTNNDIGGKARGDPAPASMADVGAFATAALTDEEYWAYVTAAT